MSADGKPSKLYWTGKNWSSQKNCAYYDDIVKAEEDLLIAVKTAVRTVVVTNGSKIFSRRKPRQIGAAPPVHENAFFDKKG